MVLAQITHSVYRFLFISEAGKNWALEYSKVDQTDSNSKYDMIAPATKAVDGNTDGIFDHHSCSYAKRDNQGFNGWDLVFDKKRLIQVDGVVITTRNDCCGEL